MNEIQVEIENMNNKNDVHKETENKLIYAAKKGDKEAINIIIVNNYDLLKGYVFKLTGDIEDTKDIVQETLLRAMMNLNRFEPKAKFSTWLITIATNIYKDNLKIKKRSIPLEEDIGFNNYNESLEERVINSIRVKEILEILKSLPYEKRAVFILKHYYNYKYEEIADIMKCPVGTVRSRLHYCIHKIIESTSHKIIKKEKED